MTQSKHTHGPWESHIGEDYAVVMLPGETTETASIMVGTLELIPLIAAAPDLLEAIEYALRDKVIEQGPRDLFQKLLDARNKAIGKSKK